MKTFIIYWRQFCDSFPEVSYFSASSQEDAIETLKREDGDDILIECVEELQ